MTFTTNKTIFVGQSTLGYDRNDTCQGCRATTISLVRSLASIHNLQGLLDSFCRYTQETYFKLLGLSLSERIAGLGGGRKEPGVRKVLADF